MTELTCRDCIRCGRTEQIEKHRIVEGIRGGTYEPENVENRCEPCHKYEHVWRSVRASLEYERQRGQKDRIKCYEHRLEILEALNTPEIIRERGTYLSYWTDNSTRYLPRRIPTKEEAEFDKEFNLLLAEAQGRMELNDTRM